MTRNILSLGWRQFARSRLRQAGWCRGLPQQTSRSLSMASVGERGPVPLLFPRPSPMRRFASASSEDSESDDEAVNSIIGDREIRDLIDSFRHSLYPNSTDPFILQLNELKSVQEVFNFLHKNQETLNGTHISQAVLVLWDLQRVFWQVCTDRSPEDNISQLKSYIKAVSGHPDFDCLLRLVSKCHEEFSADALTCTLLYLGKMGVSRRHPVQQTLLARCQKELLTFPLTALSRFMVSVQSGHLWSVAMGQPALPMLIRELQTCEDPEQFRLICICLGNLHQLITPEVLKLIKQRTRYLLDKGILGSNSPRTVVKLIHLLDFPRWSIQNSSLIRDLMLSLSGQVAELRSGDIVSLHRAFQSQLEPVNILDEIQEYTLKLLRDHDPALLPVDVLACVVPFSSTNMRQKLFEDLLVTHIQSPSFSNTMPILFKILRYLKTSNIKLCDLFWYETLVFLRRSEREDYKLLRICHKYMHFNNNLGGTYRHFEFEQHMISWLLEALQGTSGVIPTKVARIAAFIIAYGRTILPPLLVKKLEEMAPQFSILDCLNLSRGLQIATELRSRHRGSHFVDQIVTINSILSSCTRSNLSTENLSLSEVNMIMRTYINMRGVSGTDLFERLVAQYGSDHQLMTSRLLRDVTFNLVPQRCLVPSVLELMARYVAQHSTHLLGDTVEKLLFLCYSLGHSPDNQLFPQVAADLVLRDREKMTGLSLLQACLSLVFLQQLPLSLAHFVFTVEFLERLDNEIKVCYSKATYPLRVRQYLMELNRAVCLDLPQADVPWFHTKYCQEQATQDTVPSSGFHQEVLRTLCDVVGGPQFVKKNSYTPYFYKLDFEVILDERGCPLSLSQQHNLEDRKLTRVAVLLLREEAFSTGTVQLRGPALLRRRHLEILNYRQLEVSQSLWQAMYMTEEAARRSFVENSVWPTRRSAETAQ